MADSRASGGFAGFFSGFLRLSGGSQVKTPDSDSSDDDTVEEKVATEVNAVIPASSEEEEVEVNEIEEAEEEDAVQYVYEDGDTKLTQEELDSVAYKGRLIMKMKMPELSEALHSEGIKRKQYETKAHSVDSLLKLVLSQGRNREATPKRSMNTRLLDIEEQPLSSRLRRNSAAPSSADKNTRTNTRSNSKRKSPLEKNMTVEKRTRASRHLNDDDYELSGTARNTRTPSSVLKESTMPSRLITKTTPLTGR
jgi:hypothetical protein